jgi:hypothetical protein
VGHFAKICRSSGRGNNQRQVNVLEEAELDAGFLGEVETTGSKPWMVDLTLGNTNVQVHFKVDTGADVTAIPEKLFGEIFKSSQLQPSDRTLYGPGQTKLETIGKFKGVLHLDSNRNSRQHSGQSCQNIYVIKHLNQALLGRPAIEALHILSKANLSSVSESEQPAELAKYKKLFPTLFSGLGKLEGAYKIELQGDAKPFAITTPRQVPLPLMSKVKEELTRMQNLGVIKPVDQPTDWCAGMVVVPKANSERVRICVDMQRLNESVRRELHPLPSVDQTLAQLRGAKILTKLDANSGFWQIDLDEESQLLTCFMTPFGRFAFRRLPFGISSAPEHFQKRMQRILEGLDGVVCEMDDILVFGENQTEHDKRLMDVLRGLEKAGLTLNSEKCVFSVRSLKFIGHIVGENGISADPLKIKAIADMEQPTNVSEMRRFLGMANQLSKFTLDLAETTKPLRDLLAKKNAWHWSDAQDQAFKKVKSLLSSTPVLAMYDPCSETLLSSDASSYGLGGILAQKQPDGHWRPVAYASRAMSGTEQRYAQIEKEALAITWACERFNNYILGLKFHIETDHKPLVPLLGSKNLEDLPPRVQRFRLRLMRYSYTISHVPGRNMTTADTLSRAPIKSTSPAEDNSLQEETRAYVKSICQRGVPRYTSVSITP